MIHNLKLLTLLLGISLSTIILFIGKIFSIGAKKSVSKKNILNGDYFKFYFFFLYQIEEIF